MESLPRDVAVGLTVDRVADLHVVRGDRFRDRPRPSPHAEEPPHHFLARADLGEGAVFFCIQVDLERFLAGIKLFFDHLPCGAQYTKFDACPPR